MKRSVLGFGLGLCLCLPLPLSPLSTLSPLSYCVCVCARAHDFGFQSSEEFAFEKKRGLQSHSWEELVVKMTRAPTQFITVMCEYFS